MAEEITAKDTRERPKPHRAATRFPKTRTRTGCFTCRKRKKKCDEMGPSCSGCARNFLKCVWPSDSADTLPKNFKISSCSDDHFGKKHEEAIQIDDTSLSISSKEVEIRNTAKMNTDTIGKDFPLMETDISNVPQELCSVFEVHSYRHKIPFPLATTIPESIDVVIDSLSDVSNCNSTNHSVPNGASPSGLLPALDESYVNHQMISQMFDSIYSESLEKISSSSSSSSSSPMANSKDLYDDLLSYSSKTTLPTLSIKNPVLAAFREIFFARGCSYLAKNNTNENAEFSQKYIEAANKHYNNSIMVISENLNTFHFKPNATEHWSLFAIKTLCLTDQLMGLVSENCISNLISVDERMSPGDATLTLNGLKDSTGKNFDRVLFSHVLFSYPFLIYFAKFNTMINLLSPTKLFADYNEEMVAVFLDQSGSHSDSNWLDNVIMTATINVHQNLIKLTWLVRMRNSMEPLDLKNNLKQLKLDISLIWTTIQTAEIQLESTNLLIEFAKSAHMSLEILFLAVSDTSVDASSHIIGFYLDQFITSYQSYLEASNRDENIEKIPKCFIILPLFVTACAAQTLQQKEFISKELYLCSSNLGLDFIQLLTATVEDAWYIEQRNGVKAFSRLVSREGFSNLVN